MTGHAKLFMTKLGNIVSQGSAQLNYNLIEIFKESIFWEDECGVYPDLTQPYKCKFRNNSAL